MLPPNAINAVIAFSNDSRLSTSDGFKSSHTISTIRRPHPVAIRACAACTAGISDAPGRVIPIASATLIIVAAVPIVMHVPGLLAIPSSNSAHPSQSNRPARRSSQYFHTSDPEPSTVPRQHPRTIAPAGRYTLGKSIVIAPISNAGVVLSHPPISTTPSSG